MTHLTAFSASLEAVAERCEDVVPPVYAALFARFPEFEELFVLDTDQGARGHMLNEAMSMAEGLLKDDPVAVSFVSAERMNHEGYGITDEVFEGRKVGVSFVRPDNQRELHTIGMGQEVRVDLSAAANVNGISVACGRNGLVWVRERFDIGKVRVWTARR